MSKIADAFNNKKALISFIMAGDPSLSETEKIINRLAQCGADIIEIGIPFSDSIADGPVIVDAANRAIANGVSAHDIIDMIRTVGSCDRPAHIPIIFMTSYNIVYSYGVDKFINDSRKAGVSGLILPDLPLEEASQLKKKANAKGIDLIFLIAPNTSEKRVKQICELSTGFIYLVSTTGTTGVRKTVSSTVSGMVKKIRKYTKLPIAVGFGISTPEQAKEAVKHADGVIVGSAIVKLVSNISALSKFVVSIRSRIT